MRKPLLVAAAAAFTLSPVACHPNRPAAIYAPVPANTPITVVPIRIQNDHVFVDVKLNDSTVTLALDTGASTSAIDPSLLTRLGMPVPATRHIVFDSVRIGGALLRNHGMAVVPFGAVSAASLGPPLLGVIGTDVYRRFVVVFDFAALQLSLYDPKTFTYAGSGEVLAVEMRGDLPTVNVQIERTGRPPIVTRLLLDSGAGSTFSLTSDAFRGTDLFDPTVPFLRTWGAATVNGADSSTVRRVDAIRIGGLTVKSPPVMLADGLGRTLPVAIANGVIGFQVFVRTRLIVDYARGRMILEPAAGFDAPFEFKNNTGLVMQRRGGAPVVVHVIPGTPAAEAGVRKGDELLTIDDAPPPAGLALREALVGVGQSHKFSFRRGAETLNVRLTYRRLI